MDLGPCWLWTGRLNGYGYGRVKIDGRELQAHRVEYEMTYGPIPDGLQLDHLCRVRACVNPDHLEPVTCSENIRRAWRHRADYRLPKCRRGHEWTPENTLWIHQAGRAPGRVCRACKRARARANDAKARARRRAERLNS